MLAWQAAQARFDEVKEQFDRASAAVTVNSGVTSSRELPTMAEAGEEEAASDEEEADAALSRLAGQAAGTPSKKKKFFMCMPIPSL